MADIEQLSRALINADKAGDTDAARTLARAIQDMRSQEAISEGDIQQRIEQAHDVSKDITVQKGALLPISHLRRGGERMPGTTEFDPTAGVLGVAKRAGTALEDVRTGKLQLYGPEGKPTSEAITRATEVASFMLPIGVASRVTAPKVAKPSAKQIIQESAQKRVGEAEEFGVQLTRGQASDQVPIQAFEQDVLTGGRGPAAQSQLLAQRELQEEQIDTAITGIADRLAPSHSDDAFEIAENIARAVKEQAETFKAESTALYEKAGAAEAELAPQAVSRLSENMRTVLDEAGAMEGTAIAADMPTVRRIVQRIDDLASLKNAPEGEIAGVGWQNVERIRKQINAARSMGEEGRALSLMRKGLDDWIDDSVTNALISGDKQFLDDLKGARAAWRSYKEIVKSPKAIVQKMATGEVDSVQIANYLYGTSKIGGRADSAGVVREIKSLIGENHPAIMDLRRGVMIRLFKNSEGENKAFQKIATDISDLTSGKGRELFKALFGDENRLEMTKFARVLRSLKTQDLAGNVSRSGQTVMRRMSESLNKLAPLIGFSIGDFTGMVGGVLAQQALKLGARGKTRRFISTPVPPAPRQLSPSQRGIYSPAARTLGATLPPDAPALGRFPNNQNALIPAGR